MKNVAFRVVAGRGEVKEYFDTLKEAVNCMRETVKELANGRDYHYTSKAGYVGNTLVVKVEKVEVENY